MSVTTSPPPAEPAKAPSPGRERQAVSLFRQGNAGRALIDSFIKLDPRVQIRNPVMFVVEIGVGLSLTATWLKQVSVARRWGGNDPGWYTFAISFWLWLTVVFANFAEAIAEGRGRRPGRTLRRCARRPSRRCSDGLEEAPPT